MTEPSPATAAATVIPLRDTTSGPEVLMLRKNSKIAFGGMWVFPGGRVDPEDSLPGDADDLAPARRAAVREAVEEADLVLEADSLIPISHWTPPISGIAEKRFETWFFVGRAPVGDAGRVTIDGGEIHEDVWVRPDEMLERHAAGTIQLVPPTYVTLYDLVGYDSVGAVLDAFGDIDPIVYKTRIGHEGDALVTMWEGDAGYETSDADAVGDRHRVVMSDSGWRLERTRTEHR